MDGSQTHKDIRPQLPVEGCAGELCAHKRRVSQLEAELCAAKKQIKKLEKDRLTGLPNRHALEKELGRLIQGIKENTIVSKNRRRKKPEYLALLMIDLDHFKKINDRRGHKTGDDVLKKVARALRKIVRQEDLMCKGRSARYGGEELIVCFRCAREQDVFAVAENMRAELEKLTHRSHGTNEEFRATASIGATALPNSYIHKHGKRKIMKELLAVADYALYAAKANGRNFTCYTDNDGNLIKGGVGSLPLPKYHPAMQLQTPSR